MTDRSEEKPRDRPLPGFSVGAPAARPTLTLDVSLYEEFFAGSNLTEAQKRELLEALWQIVVGFVDLGFRVEPADEAVSAENESNPAAAGNFQNDDDRNFNGTAADRRRAGLATNGRSVIESAVHSSIHSFDKAAGRGREPRGA